MWTDCSRKIVNVRLYLDAITEICDEFRPPIFRSMRQSAREKDAAAVKTTKLTFWQMVNAQPPWVILSRYVCIPFNVRSGYFIARSCHHNLTLLFKRLMLNFSLKIRVVIENLDDLIIFIGLFSYWQIDKRDGLVCLDADNLSVMKGI